MDTPRKTLLVTTERAFLFAAALAGLVFLRCPGADSGALRSLLFLRNMVRSGLVSGFQLSAADQPPLASAFLLGMRQVCAVAHADDLTSIKVCLLLFYAGSVVVFRSYWKGFAPLAAFVGTILLSGIMQGYLDILCAPTLLLALWALRRRRIALFSALYAVTCLVQWQAAVIAPFLFWEAVRPATAGEERDEVPAGRWLARLVWPGGLVILAASLVFGRSLLLALQAALANPYLSATALNANWVWTFLLHCQDPAAFGPLVNGYPVSNAYPLAISPLINGYVKPVLYGPLGGWVWLPRAFFAGLYVTTLWRFTRCARSFPDLLRAALFGSLAYCLFGTGVRQNDFFLAALLACALASADPRETARAVLVTGMAALNLVIFDGFLGNGLGYPRVMGVDLTAPLALLYVGLYLWWWVSWLLSDRRARRTVLEDTPLAPGGPRANVPDLTQRA